MAISIEKYIEQTPVKRGRRRSSKIWGYEQEVLQLKERDYSYEQILEFLRKNDVEVKLSTLISFVRRAKKQKEEAARRRPK
jgi:hypothetical protein